MMFRPGRTSRFTARPQAIICCSLCSTLSKNQPWRWRGNGAHQMAKNVLVVGLPDHPVAVEPVRRLRHRVPHLGKMRDRTLMSEDAAPKMEGMRMREAGRSPVARRTWGISAFAGVGFARSGGLAGFCCWSVSGAAIWLAANRCGCGSPLCGRGARLDGIFEQRVRGLSAALVARERTTLPFKARSRRAQDAVRIASVLQRVGLFGRCSFDAVMVMGQDRELQPHWREWPGRWGAVSNPMTAALRPNRRTMPEALAFLQA